MATPLFTPDLLDDFAKGRVAVFLGAGVSAAVSTRTGKSIRTWAAFLEATAESTGDRTINSEVTDLIGKGDYLFACEILKEHFGERWDKVLKEEFEQIGELSRLQVAVLGLQQRILVTTNFDLFLESNWDRANPQATHHLQVKNGLSPDCFAAFRDDRPYLIKLHGSINNPESMIFSLSDYASKAHSNWQYSSFLEMLLCTHTVVFIGFSMKDAAITNLLEIYAQKYPKSRPHYAFMPDFGSDRRARIMKNFRKLFIVPYDSRQNHRQLTTFVDRLKKQVEQRKKLLTAGVA